jgi:hypothetical protein
MLWSSSSSNNGKERSDWGLPHRSRYRGASWSRWLTFVDRILR